MRESWRQGLLGFFAALSKNLAILPAILLLRAVLFGGSGGTTAMLLYLAFTLAGFMAGKFVFTPDRVLFRKLGEASFLKVPLFLLNITEKGRFVSSAAGYASLLIAAAASVLLSAGNGIWSEIFEAVFSVLLYLIALKSANKSYADLFENNAFYFRFFFIAAAIAASGYFAQGIPLKPGFYFALYVYILILLVLKNQENIDSNIYSKKYIQKSILPGNMRSFNLFTVIILFSAALLLFNFKTVVLGLMEAAGKFFILIMLIALRLLGRLFPATADNPPDTPAPADFGFFGGGEEVVHPFLNLLGNTVRTFILLYVLYKLIPFLLKKIFAFLLKLIAFLKLHTGRNIPGGEAFDYYDETESVKPVKEKRLRKKMNKSLKNAEHELGRVTDPIRRTRLIYAILLRKLEGAGVGRNASDTPAEIYRKSRHINGVGNPFLAVTAQYEKVRYGGKVPDTAELSRYEEDYAEIAHKI